jgi:membrane protein
LGVAVAFLYWASPNITLPFKLVTPGAALFIVVWLIATIGFAIYVANFGAYNATYGALGGVVVLLVWLYLSSLLLLLGAVINAVLEKRVDPQRFEEQRVESRAEAA